MSGAPPNPISGVPVAPRISRIASATKGAISSASGTRNASTWAAERIGSPITGPGLNSMSTPIGGSGVMMSWNKIAASTPYRRTGCNVTSQASSGSRASSQNEYFSFRARYSGRCRPA